jgi:hypothetical protein
MTRFLRLGALAALAALTLAGCSGHPSGTAGASPSPSAMSNDQVLAIGQQAAQCMRQHGIPDFPDPVIDQHGQLSLPQGPAGDHVKAELNANPDAEHACQPILDRLPAGATGNRPEYTQEDLANLLKFAQCMRRNRMPDWPDPKADGSFPIHGTPLETEGKSPRLRAAMQACRQYWDRGIVGS